MNMDSAVEYALNKAGISGDEQSNDENLKKVYSLFFSNKNQSWRRF